jgi:hypothetical protein
MLDALTSNQNICLPHPSGLDSRGASQFEENNNATMNVDLTIGFAFGVFLFELVGFSAIF